MAAEEPKALNDSQGRPSGKFTQHRRLKAGDAISFRKVCEELLIRRPSRSRVNASTEDHRLDTLSPRCQLGSSGSETEYFVVGM